MSFVRRFATLLLALLLPACAPLDAPPANAAEAYHGPAIWKVADRDTTIYLFGTIHALPKDAQWFAGPVARAYGQSNELVTEIPMNDPAGDARTIAEHALLPPGQSLRDMMTPEDRKQFEAALVSLGFPVEAMDRYQPWYAALVMTLRPVTQAGYDPQSGAETELSAKADNKRRAALETVDQQVALFAGLPTNAQLVLLDQTAESVATATATFDMMVADWMKGDPEALAMLINQDMDDPVLYKRLLTDRNARWARWIDQRMKRPGTVFVAVGAGHLAGKGSVQEQLRKLGIKARRVWQ